MIVRLERNAPHQKYFLKDGSQVAGCSTICKLGEPYEGLLHWAWMQGKEGKNYRQTVGRAADIGHVLHFMVDCHLNNNEPDLREFEKKDIDKAENAFIKFLDFWEGEGLHLHKNEHQLTSETYRYGGTLDLVAKDEHERLVLLDFKTSKDVYSSHKWQLGGYEGLWMENYPEEPISRRAIVRVDNKEEGEFKTHWITNEKAKHHIAIFRAQANLYNTIRDFKT